jgi:hypothetical protein
MSESQIAVNKCYQTADGEFRCVTAITILGEVIFNSYREGGPEARYIEGEQMPGTVFAQDVEREVPLPEALQSR